MKVERFNWTELDEIKLIAYWRAGDTLTQIGKALGCTRNAVAGKAKRLGLPRRPSPIKRKVAA